MKERFSHTSKGSRTLVLLYISIFQYLLFDVRDGGARDYERTGCRLIVTVTDVQAFFSIELFVAVQS